MMQRPAPIRAPRGLPFATATLCALVTVGAAAQVNLPGPQRLPATQPTNQLTNQPTAQPSSQVSVPASNQPHRAEVTYADGQLSVAASNSSLNQILREISRQTGMKVTGGVADERVFGSYGPAIPAKVLAALLDGTGSNMLLVQSPANTLEAPKAPVELVLTPRHGGPTPPNPNAAGFGDAGDLQAIEPDRQGMQPDASPFRGPPQQTSTPVDPNRAIIPSALPTSTDTTTTTDDKSPNGVKTPQQIYEQLLRLRQQQTPAPQ
jgi:hypothetical protein